MSHPFHSSQCGCAHETLDVAQLATLYPSIDHERIRCFNESQPGQGRSIVRPWEQRHLPSPPLQSHSDDAELLLFVPFTSTVTVKALTLITAGDHAPDKLRLSAASFPLLAAYRASLPLTRFPPSVVSASSTERTSTWARWVTCRRCRS